MTRDVVDFLLQQPKFLVLNIFLMIFYFFHYSWFTVLCQFPTVQQWPSHIYILFPTLSCIMFHHKWLDIVPGAIQQSLEHFNFWTLVNLNDLGKKLWNSALRSNLILFSLRLPISRHYLGPMSCVFVFCLFVFFWVICQFHG